MSSLPGAPSARVAAPAASLPRPLHLFVLRHGECLSNTRVSRPGWTDADDVLTERGREQAARAGEALRTVLPAGCRVLCSPLTRARQTAELALGKERLEKDVLVDRRLEEKHALESYEAATRRALDAVWAHRDASSLLCVTHGHIIEALVAVALGVPPPPDLYPLHCALTYFRHGKLVCLNLATHLVEVSSADLWPAP